MFIYKKKGLSYKNLPMSGNVNTGEVEFKFQDKSNDLLMIGDMKNGIPAGQWKYNIYPDSIIDIEWNSYTNKNESFKIIYPTGWHVFPSKKGLFQVSMIQDTASLNDNYFLILSHDKTTYKDLTKIKYLKKFVSSLSKNTVKKYTNHSIVDEDSSKYFYSYYQLNKDEKSVLILNFLFDKNNTIYDVTLSVDDKNISQSINDRFLSRYNVIFLEMVRSIRINGERIFSPFKKIIKLDKL
jgi:hypothetical protein